MIHAKKVTPPTPPPPAPVITITLEIEFAKKLNQQLEDLEDKFSDPTRELFLTINPVVRGEYAEMER
jgi:hypothetical protein